MSDHLFLEEGEYFAFITVYESKESQWDTSVLFERRSDHANTLVHGIRHKLGDNFPSKAVAMDAARSYVDDRVRLRDTGLE
ncbi:hypothetical protein ACZ75_06605 [Massilia sp. NR 4-1]|nr:hypothetical protein ACZ75_06605 [Massilia sp. NR 4-1]